MYGKKQSEKQKKIVSEKLKGVPKNKESVAKQRESILKTLNSDGYVHPNTGRKITEEQSKRLSEIVKNRPKTTCINCNKTLDVANHARYHGNKCKNRL